MYGDMSTLREQPVKVEAYRGYIVAGAGMRINPEEAGATGSSVFVRDWMLSWALNAERTLPGPKKIDIHSESASFKEVVAALAATSSYSEQTPAAIWGLTEYNRQQLRDVVQGNVTAVADVLSWLNQNHSGSSAYHSFDGFQQSIRVRRSSAGVEQLVAKATNGNKSGIQLGQVHASSDAIRRELYANVHGQKASGANAGWKAEYVEATESYYLYGDGFSPRVVDSLGGEVLWDLEFTPTGIIIHSLLGSQTTRPDKPTVPVITKPKETEVSLSCVLEEDQLRCTSSLGLTLTLDIQTLLGALVDNPEMAKSLTRMIR